MKTSYVSHEIITASPACNACKLVWLLSLNHGRRLGTEFGGKEKISLTKTFRVTFFRKICLFYVEKFLITFFLLTSYFSSYLITVVREILGDGWIGRPPPQILRDSPQSLPKSPPVVWTLSIQQHVSYFSVGFEPDKWRCKHIWHNHNNENNQILLRMTRKIVINHLIKRRRQCYITMDDHDGIHIQIKTTD